MQRAASQPPGAARATRVRSALRAPTSLLLVAGEPVVGMLLVELAGRRLEVTMLCVHPDHQGDGIGRALVTAVVDRYPTVAAWTVEPERCEALGFARTGAVRDDGSVELVPAQALPHTTGP